VKSLGAEVQIDYTQEDFTGRNEQYDVIFDAVGKFPPRQARKSLTKKGRYINVLTTSVKGHREPENMILLRELMAEGKLKTVIDRCYRMDEIVEAHRYVDLGHKKGNVIVTVEHEN
jgi:NADPH:quinone reductase-like Zn-dependent oxidoreductase